MVSPANLQPAYNHSFKVIVPGGISVAHLGVVRSFGRRNIPVIYLDSAPKSMVRYSRYITKRVASPSIKKTETGFIKTLLDVGKHFKDKMVIIPTGDREILTLSKYRHDLKQFYHIPVAPYETVNNLVNKKNFYQLLAEKQVAHPATFFPADLDELRLMGREIPYPYIIKPADSLSFRENFARKCFVINSAQELDMSVERLRDKNLDIMIQEIIPGEERYAAYLYFNRKSEPLAFCGYDKVRQFTPDFGSGSCCRSMFRPTPIALATNFLTGIGYHGIAEPEFKKDPRDEKYKLIEINARTSTENGLSAACGVDIEYIAYLDVSGQEVKNVGTARNGIVWVDDFFDILSCLMQLKQGRLGMTEIVRSLKAKKVHSVAAWDDLAPFFVQARSIGVGVLKHILFNKIGKKLTPQKKRR
jgi:D-aspartate ligase